MASTSRSGDQQNDAEKESRRVITEIIEAYDAVLEANRDLDQQYKAQEEKLGKKLLEVQAELQKIKAKREEKAQNKSNSTPSTSYYTVGKPYFKDKDFNPPPDNEDTILMKQLGMYDFSNVMAVSGWTVGDRSRLLSVLLDISKAKIKKQIYDEISVLRRKNVSKVVTCKIAQLKRELVALKNKTLESLDLPLDEDFDWDEVAQKLNKRHSSREYKAIWNLFFHPKVNKSLWSPEEHQELQRLAAQKKMQDWESIAKALNTGRTGYQCFVYFRTNMDHSGCGRKWTLEEMNYLERVINHYKEDDYIPWGKVAASIENRTKIQCYNKYTRMIEGKKGRFLPEEDAVILNFVNVYGPDYRRMASFLMGRSSSQLRVRHRLLQRRVSATWSLNDDRKLLQVMANQDSPANFSTATRHFPGKDRQNIRSRYMTLMRWMKKHPHSDISTAPRRAARRLAHGEPKSNLMRALDELRRKMQADLHAARPKAKLARDSSDAMLHDSLLSTVSMVELRSQLAATTVTETQRAKVNDCTADVQVRDITSTPQEETNYNNLKNILMLLNASLDEKFYSTKVGKKMAELKKPQSLAPVARSYSKQTPTADEPDEVGKVAGRRRYLFPPNFALLTGSRVILTQLNVTYSQERKDTNIKTLMRRNPLLREHMATLRERFNDLFTWAYILSNEPPDSYADPGPQAQMERRPYRRAKPKVSVDSSSEEE